MAAPQRPTLEDGTGVDPVPSRGPGRPPRSPAERATQRSRLLDAAMAAIRRVGPDVSVDEIAIEAGVSKPVLYSEFGGRDGIAEALAIELATRAQNALFTKLAAAGTLDTAAGLRMAIDSLISLVTDEPQVYGFLVRCMRASDQGLLDNALVRTLHSRVAMLTGLLAPDTSPSLLSVLTHGTFGFVFAAVESWQATRTPDREELIDALVTVVLHGFQAIGGPPLSTKKAGRSTRAASDDG
jgi:AcrR family transcriptional regulator